MAQPRPDSTPAPKAPVQLVPSNATHGPTCGPKRVECPVHGAPYGPNYLPAEVQNRLTGTFVFAHDCHQIWRVAA